ncbi:hypothetical protein JTB14_035621 [Gonioctena quinquepunctata]|nr:hypothetical protein JTB14_035621 [Gonioctena quinquepunctata]
MCPKKYKEPEFAKPKSRAKATEKQYRRRSRIQVLEVKQQRPRTISTSDDDNSDSSTSQFKRKRVESPIRDCPAEIKPCDCGGDSSNHMIFYERNDGPLKRHKCIGSKADTQKHAGCELYTNNEYNKRMKELNAFESKYAGEVDLKQHPLASEKGTKTLTAKENKITRSYRKPLYVPAYNQTAEDEQQMNNKKSEMTTRNVPGLGKELVIVIEEMDATAENLNMTEEDRKHFSRRKLENKGKNENRPRSQKPYISAKDLEEAGPSRKQVYNYQKPDSRQPTGDTEDTDNSKTSGKANPKRKKTSTLEDTKLPKEKQLQKQFKDNMSRLSDIDREIHREASKRTTENMNAITQALACIPAEENVPLLQAKTATWEAVQAYWVGFHKEQRMAEIEEYKEKVKKYPYLNEKAKRDLATPRGRQL